MSDPKRKKLKRVIVAATLVLVMVAIAVTGWATLSRRTPLTDYAAPEDHFKYGSVGTEAVEGIPYWIWVVLPRLFPEKLPGSGGYTSLGLTWEEGREMPIGLTKETIGFDRVGMNCAVCHVGTVRTAELANPTFILGGPSTKFDVQRYVRFLFACANDPRFTATFILPEIEYNHHLSLFESLLYRFIIIPRTKKALLAQEQSFAWMNSRPATGPGRTDINPFKIRVLGLADDGSVGSADVMAIWNEGAHEGFHRHADGLNTSLRESIVSGALGTGTTPKEINLNSLDRLESWMKQVQSPPFPFPVDQALAEQGQKIFTAQCATCHALGGARTGQVIPLSEVKTDPNRADHWTQAAADAFNEFAASYAWDFDQFGDTDGYTALSLEGLWARAPYLHNGSIPSLASLLAAPEDRPTRFYRGYDIYDPESVGFVSTGDKAAAVGFEVDTTVIGNGNQGHLYGTELPAADKRSLIEYLKTL
ncbi:MAG: c-type cytochrome [Leptolyngbyaceae cyanobacterium]